MRKETVESLGPVIVVVGAILLLFMAAPLTWLMTIWWHFWMGP